ncbi:MAG: efflux RND transporter permease subunit [Chthoniobacteraceae bacterium]
MASRRRSGRSRARSPEGVQIVPTYDRSELIHRAIATLRDKLIEESLVVALVCVVFLWHVRSALVAIITLPIAILLFVPADVRRWGSPATSCRSAASRSPSARWWMRRSSWWRMRTRPWNVSGMSTGASRTAASGPG